MHRALDPLPVNVLLLGKGNTVSMAALKEQALAGAAGYKVHEDWGSSPAAIDASLRAAEEWGLQVALHSDSLNEAGFVESTIAAIGGRSIHAFHVEGAGGGHAPDILSIAGLPNVIPGSTNPTLPHTVNTVAEHLDMLMVCHHLNPAVPEDLAFAESRIRATTIAAEDILHDIGALSVTSSDAQAMGRIGEVVTRTWQVAHVMKHRRGPLGGGMPADNERAKRYVAKYTINPAIAHGIAYDVGSIEVGRLADLAVWDPKFFGVRPAVVVKGGAIAWAALGDPNASIPTPQPVMMRPSFGDTIGADLSVTVRLAGGAGCRPRRDARPAPSTGRGRAHASHRQGRHEEQRHPAVDPHPPRHVRDRDRRRRRRACTRGIPPPRPAVQPVLMTVHGLRRAHRSPCCSPMRAFPAAGTRTRRASSRRCSGGIAVGDVPPSCGPERGRRPWSMRHSRRRPARRLDCAPVAPIERAWAARTPSRAIRDASKDLGRGLLRLAQRSGRSVRRSPA